jgi:hypothetical protein
MADVKVNNDGTLGSFHKNIDKELLESDRLGKI